MNRKDINLIAEQYARLYTEEKVRSLNASGAKYIKFVDSGEAYQVDPYREMPPNWNPPSGARAEEVNVMNGEDIQEMGIQDIPLVDRNQWFVVDGENDHTHRAVVMFAEQYDEFDEDEFGEFEEPEQAEVAIEVYIRREGDSFVEYSKKTLYDSIKARLQEHGISVTPYKQTFTNGSSVLELTAHVEGTPEQAIDYDIGQIERAVSETTGGEGNRFNFDVYIAGDYPE